MSDDSSWNAKGTIIVSKAKLSALRDLCDSAAAEAAYWRERCDGLQAAVELGETEAMACANEMATLILTNFGTNPNMQFSSLFVSKAIKAALKYRHSQEMLGKALGKESKK